MRALVWEIFFLVRILYQLTNVDLVLKDMVCEKYETKSPYFVATSYHMQTKDKVKSVITIR